MPTPTPLDPAEFGARFSSAARARGFDVCEFGRIHEHPLVAYTKRPGEAAAPRLYLSSGMHGDEPAPPWAMLRLLEGDFFDARAAWYLCPVLNPTGLARGTRENFANIDLNRDYKDPRTDEIQAHVAWLRQQPSFEATFCLHEDYDAHGFYLYELNPDQRPTLAEVALRAAALHCPIEDAAIIDGRDAAAPGIIRPVSDPLLRESWPEAIYLRHHHTNLSYTFESPTPLPLDVRVGAQAAGVQAAINTLLHTRDAAAAS